MRIVKGDTVVVVTGDDRGKTGKVLHVWYRGKKRDRAIVEGVNFVKRATRRSQKNPQGGLAEKEAPVVLANLMLFCPKCNRGARVVSSRLPGSRRPERKCAKCGHVLSA